MSGSLASETKSAERASLGPQTNRSEQICIRAWIATPAECARSPVAASARKRKTKCPLRPDICRAIAPRVECEMPAGPETDRHAKHRPSTWTDVRDQANRRIRCALEKHVATTEHRPRRAK